MEYGSFPVLDSEQAQQSRPATVPITYKAPVLPTAAPQRQCDIVVADDEVPIAEVIAELLREEGYAVTVCHDGAAAQMVIFSCRPALVLLDNAMPNKSGAELLQEIRNAGLNDLPVIMMSAGSQLNEFLAQGANAVIAKPFEIDKLLDQVIACLPAT